MKKFFYITVIIEIAVVIILVVKIRNNRNDVLGEVIFNPMNKNNIQQVTQSELPYYFEPKAASPYSTSIYGYTGNYSINKEGLNDRYDYPLQKPDKAFRIVTLGDSFTFGLYVDTSKNWPEKLEDLLNNSFKCSKFNKFEVINLGVPGYDLEFASERFKLHGKQYNPDAVIWLIKVDDMNQINTWMYPKKNKYEEELKKTGEYDELVRKGTPYPAWNKVRKELVQAFSLKDLINFQSKILAQFQSSYEKKILYMKLPNGSGEKDENNLENLLLSSMKNYDNIFYHNLSYIYKANENYIPKDRHPTAQGHTIIANNIFEYIKTSNIIPCN